MSGFEPSKDTHRVPYPATDISNWSGKGFSVAWHLRFNLIITKQCQATIMKLKVIIHEAEEGGYWAEVPAISGCATQGDSFEELLANLYEAVEACLSVDLEEIEVSDKDIVLELAV
jgi:predicted RNase H-like HicB family nuclease